MNDPRGKRFKQFRQIFKTPHENALDARIASYINDEPETIKWIEGFKSGDVFYDIGSNIGGFSFYAALCNRSVEVHSFEPNFMNFHMQQKTILEHNFTNVHAYNLALNHENKVESFLYNSNLIGRKGTFGFELKDQMSKSQYGNPHKSNSKPYREVSTLGMTLDTLIFDMGLSKPSRIKIDVDGNDLLVLKGAERFLRESESFEVFVEIDEKIYPQGEIQTFMKEVGMEEVSSLNVGTEQKPMLMILYRK